MVLLAVTTVITRRKKITEVTNTVLIISIKKIKVWCHLLNKLSQSLLIWKYLSVIKKYSLHPFHIFSPATSQMSRKTDVLLHMPWYLTDNRLFSTKFREFTLFHIKVTIQASLAFANVVIMQKRERDCWRERLDLELHGQKAAALTVYRILLVVRCLSCWIVSCVSFTFHYLSLLSLCKKHTTVLSAQFCFFHELLEMSSLFSTRAQI